MSKISMDAVIDRLFKRLSATYGASWTRQYADTPMGDVKTAWMHELEGYMERLGAIAFALENLPERCPNVIQFRNICRSAPSVQAVQIERAKADPAIVAMVLQGMADKKPVNTQHDEKEWARRILSRHEQGEKIRTYSLNLARGALNIRTTGVAA